MLKCDNLGIVIAGQLLVRDLSLELGKGELICMLGPNGVGKTLTLHTLAGLLPPSTGTLRLNGERMNQLSRRQIAQQLGLLLQDDAESFPATVNDAVRMGRHPYLGPLTGESATDIEYAERAMAAMELTGFGHRAVATLSGGERRRVAIARLLTQNPAILLLDEPVNHLDPRHQVATMNRFRDLAKSGAGILVSLHDSALAMRYADRALLLFADGSWLLGDVSAVLTAANLERLFSTAYQSFHGANGNSILLPG